MPTPERGSRRAPSQYLQTRLGRPGSVPETPAVMALKMTLADTQPMATESACRRSRLQWLRLNRARAGREQFWSATKGTLLKLAIKPLQRGIAVLVDCHWTSRKYSCSELGRQRVAMKVASGAGSLKCVRYASVLFSLEQFQIDARNVSSRNSLCAGNASANPSFSVCRSVECSGASESK